MGSAPQYSHPKLHSDSREQAWIFWSKHSNFPMLMLKESLHCLLTLKRWEHWEEQSCLKISSTQLKKSSVLMRQGPEPAGHWRQQLDTSSKKQRIWPRNVSENNVHLGHNSWASQQSHKLFGVLLISKETPEVFLPHPHHTNQNCSSELTLQIHLLH